MKIIYQLRTTDKLDEEGMLRKVYGVEALDGENTVVASYDDIFTDEKTASEFVARCNSLDLSIVHLRDAIEDALIV